MKIVNGEKIDRVFLIKNYEVKSKKAVVIILT